MIFGLLLWSWLEEETTLRHSITTKNTHSGGEHIEHRPRVIFKTMCWMYVCVCVFVVSVCWVCPGEVPESLSSLKQKTNSKVPDTHIEVSNMYVRSFGRNSWRKARTAHTVQFTCAEQILLQTKRSHRTTFWLQSQCQFVPVSSK